MIQVRAADGAIVNFPDGTPTTVINRAMQQDHAARAQHVLAGQQREKTGAGPLHGASLTVQSTLPGFPEIGAGMAATAGSVDNMLHGRPANFGGEWTKARSYQQGLQGQFQQDHPGASGLLRGVGYDAQVIPALLTGGASEAPAAIAAARAGLGATVKRVAVNTGRNALTGATYAAVNAGSQPGTAQQRAQAAANAMLPGAAAGVAIPAAVGAVKVGAKTVQAVAPRVGAVTSEALDAASRAMTGKTTVDQARPLPPHVASQGQKAAVDYLRGAGATPEALDAAHARAGGKPITTAEAMGPSGISQAAGLIRRAGTAAQTADATMTARASDRASRILNDIHETTGVDPVSARGNVQAIVDRGRAAAGPLYDSAYSQRPPQSDALDALLKRPSAQAALARAVRIAAEEGRNPSTLGFQFNDAGDVTHIQTPSVQTLDYVKRGLDDVLNTRRDPVTGRLNLDEEGRAILGTLNDFKGIVTNPAHPAGAAYGKALGASGDYLSVQDAFDRAKGTLFGATRDPRAFGAYFENLTPAQQDATRAGMANDIFAKINNGQLRPGSFDAPAVQQKLVTAFGEDAAQRLLDRMATEAKMSAASARMTPNLNSTTGDVIGSAQDRGDINAVVGAARVAGNAMTGNVGGAVRAAGGLLLPFASAARQPLDMATRNALGDLLYQAPAETAQALRAQSNAFQPRPGDELIPKSITALRLATSANAGAGSADQPSQ